MKVQKLHLTQNMDRSIYFKNIEIQMSEITIIIKKIEFILKTPNLRNSISFFKLKIMLTKYYLKQKKLTNL